MTARSQKSKINLKSHLIYGLGGFCLHISKKYTNKSLPEIAKMFDKTHATIIHGVRNITKRMDVEPELRRSFEQIINELGCSPDENID